MVPGEVPKYIVGMRLHVPEKHDFICFCNNRNVTTINIRPTLNANQIIEFNFHTLFIHIFIEIY